jgi:hypothetical protein
MPVIPVGFGQASYHFIGGAAPTGAWVTFGFFHGLSLISTQEIADQMYANISPVVTGLSGSLALADVLVKTGPNDTGPSAIADGETVGGTGASFPPNAAILVHKLTELGGRKGRGRAYFPGVGESLADNAGLLTTTYRNAFQANMETFLANCDADNLPLVLLHNDSTEPTELTGFNTDQKLATQRRRLRR